MVLPHLTISSAFFFNDTATTEIYTLSLHDALPILVVDPARLATLRLRPSLLAQRVGNAIVRRAVGRFDQDRQLVTVVAETQVSDPADLSRIPVAAGPNGSDRKSVV